MEDIQAFAVMAFWFLVLLVMIRAWNRIADFIGNLLGIRRCIDWLLAKGNGPTPRS